MIYLIAPGHAAIADNSQLAQLLVAVGYRIVDKYEYDRHIESLLAPEYPDSPPRDDPPRFDAHGFDN